MLNQFNDFNMSAILFSQNGKKGISTAKVRLFRQICKYIDYLFDFVSQKTTDSLARMSVGVPHQVGIRAKLTSGSGNSYSS